VSTADVLLPDGVDTSFAEIDKTMAHLMTGGQAPIVKGRALASIATATVVAVGPRSRLVEAAVALKTHAQAGGIRAILIASGEETSLRVRVTATEIALEGLRTQFVNNAVGALRLPSLPTLVWWRGDDPGQTEDIARLADRLVLDSVDPAPVWALVDTLVKEAPVSDLRWTALTRWRALMAHFFDMPGVAAAATKFTRLHVTGADRAAARLFAGWLGAASGAREAKITVEEQGRTPVDAVTFGSDRDELSLRRLPNSSCVEGHARIDGREASRIASLGDQNLTALIAEELRVRSRDVAFEAAARAAGAIA
jgi:hypothetical protein